MTASEEDCSAKVDSLYSAQLTSVIFAKNAQVTSVLSNSSFQNSSKNGRTKVWKLVGRIVCIRDSAANFCFASTFIDCFFTVVVLVVVVVVVLLLSAVEESRDVRCFFPEEGRVSSSSSYIEAASCARCCFRPLLLLLLFLGAFPGFILAKGSWASYVSGPEYSITFFGTANVKSGRILSNDNNKLHVH